MGRPVAFSLGVATALVRRFAGFPKLGNIVRELPPLDGVPEFRRGVRTQSSTSTAATGFQRARSAMAIDCSTRTTTRGAAGGAPGFVVDQRRPAAGLTERATTAAASATCGRSDRALDPTSRRSGSPVRAWTGRSHGPVVVLAFAGVFCFLASGIGADALFSGTRKGTYDSRDWEIATSNTPIVAPAESGERQDSGGSVTDVGVGESPFPRMLLSVSHPTMNDPRLSQTVRAWVQQVDGDTMEVVCEADVRRLSRCPATGRPGTVAELGWGLAPSRGAGYPRSYTWCIGLTMAGTITRHRQSQGGRGMPLVNCDVLGSRPERPDQLRLSFRFSISQSLREERWGLYPNLSCQLRFVHHDGRGQSRLRADFHWVADRYLEDRQNVAIAARPDAPIAPIVPAVRVWDPRWAVEHERIKVYRPIGGPLLTEGETLQLPGLQRVGSSLGLVFVFGCLAAVAVVVGWLGHAMCRERYRRWRRRRQGWQPVTLIDEEQPVAEEPLPEREREPAPGHEPAVVPLARARLGARYLVLGLCLCGIGGSANAEFWGLDDPMIAIQPVNPTMFHSYLQSTVRAFVRQSTTGQPELVCQAHVRNLTHCPATGETGGVVELGWGLTPPYQGDPTSYVSCAERSLSGAVTRRDESVAYDGLGTVACRELGGSPGRPDAMETAFRLSTIEARKRDVERLSCQIRFLHDDGQHQSRLRADFLWYGQEWWLEMQRRGLVVSHPIDGVFFNTPTWTVVTKATPRPRRSDGQIFAHNGRVLVPHVVEPQPDPYPWWESMVPFAWTVTTGVATAWILLMLGCVSDWRRRWWRWRVDPGAAVQNHVGPRGPQRQAAPPANQPHRAWWTWIFVLNLCLTGTVAERPRLRERHHAGSVSWSSHTGHLGTTDDESPVCPIAEEPDPTRETTPGNSWQSPGTADLTAANMALNLGDDSTAVVVDDECRGALGDPCLLRCRFAGYGQFLEVSLMWAASEAEVARGSERLLTWQTQHCEQYRSCRRSPGKEAGLQCGFAGVCTFDLGLRSNDAARPYRCVLHRSDETLSITRSYDEQVLHARLRTQMSPVFQLGLVTSHAEAVVVGCGDGSSRAGVRVRLTVPVGFYDSGVFEWQHHPPGENDRVVPAGAVHFNRTNVWLVRASADQGEASAPRDTTDGTTRGALDFEYFGWQPGVFHGYLTLDGLRRFSTAVDLTADFCDAVTDEPEPSRASHWWGPVAAEAASTTPSGRGGSAMTVVTAEAVVPDIVRLAWDAETYLHAMGGLTLVVVLTAVFCAVLIFLYQRWAGAHAVLADAVRRTLGGPTRDDVEALIASGGDTDSLASRAC